MSLPSTGIVKALGLTLLAAAVLTVALAPSLARADVLAVFPLKNNGQKQYAGLSSGISAMLSTNLSKSELLQVADPGRVEAALGMVHTTAGAPTLDDALKAASELGADYAVTGEFVVFGNRFRVDVRLYEVATGEMKTAEKAQAKEDEFFEMVDELSNRLIIALTGALPVAGGMLSVNSLPPGASLLLDGEKAGQTPVRMPKVAAGPHKIELSLSGYRDYTDTVVVKERELSEVEVELVPLFGGIRIWWKEVPESDVSISGEIIGLSQFPKFMTVKYARNFPEGSYKVTVRLPYKPESEWSAVPVWKTYSSEFDVVSGEVTDVFIRNDRRDPGIEVGRCGSCAANWDFDTNLVWFEGN